MFLLQRAGLGQTRHDAVRSIWRSRAGEVMGLAGLLGSGRTETAKLCFGIEPPDHGELSHRRQNSCAPFRAPGGAPRTGLLFRRPEKRRAGAASFRARKFDSRDAGQAAGRCGSLPRKEQDAVDRTLYRRAEDQDAQRRDAHPKSFRRQPAKSFARALAGAATEAHHPRRTDARH